MISLMEFNKDLLSSYIKREYKYEQEQYNLWLFGNTVEDIEDKHDVYKPINLNYEEYVDENLSNLDLIETALSCPSTVYNLTMSLIVFNFRYLKQNYYESDNSCLWITLEKIYEYKNNDYNNSAEKQLMLDGMNSYKIRLLDKISRLYAYTVKEDMKVKDEKKKDTIMDLIGYCMIFCIWYRKGMPKYR